MREFEWLESHQEEKRKYKGEYIAVVGEKIVAHGINLAQVIAQAKKLSAKPLIAKIPEGEDLMII
jgi:hypothetical protein